MRRLILASASPRRAGLIALLGIPYEIRPSSVNEEALKLPGHPFDQAVCLALAKASDVAKSAWSRGDWVLGADTMVCVDDKILGKPRDKDDARSMLLLLSGRAHTVVTGLALARESPEEGLVTYTAREVTKVWMTSLTRERISAYIDTGEPMDKAGAYGIQGMGGAFIPKIEGCYSNVVGLPLYRTSRLLEDAGIAFEPRFYKEGKAYD